MDLLEITDNLIDDLVLRMPTNRKTATEAVILCLAWLSRRGLLRAETFVSMEDQVDVGELEVIIK